MSTATFRFTTGTAVCSLAARALSAASAASASTTLSGNRGLFISDRPVEHAEGNVELAVNLRRAFVLRHGATATAARTATVVRAAASTATRLTASCSCRAAP